MYVGAVSQRIVAVVALVVLATILGLIIVRRSRPVTETPEDAVARGYALMKHVDVIIAGITRDNASHMAETLQLIDRIGKRFHGYHVVIYENDSTDKTVTIIRNWEHRNKAAASIQFVADKLNWPAANSTGGFSQQRFTKLAYCRNRVLQMVREERYGHCNYVIMLDMDQFNFDIDGLADSFGKHKDWDQCFANGVFDGQTYYDALAFRNHEFDDTFNSEDQRVRAQRIYPETSNLVPVDSAFGALAIYKRQCLMSCDYQDGDCEHVSLHRCQAADESCARLRMNPRMKLLYHF
jgi:mannosyltransferase 1 (CAP59)